MRISRDHKQEQYKYECPMCGWRGNDPTTTHMESMVYDSCPNECDNEIGHPVRVEKVKGIGERMIDIGSDMLRP